MRRDYLPHMRWDEKDQAWYGNDSQGRTIRVSAETYKRQEDDEVWYSVLQDPDAWSGMVGVLAGVTFYEA